LFYIYNMLLWSDGSQINFVLAYENCGSKSLKWGEWVFEPDHFSRAVAQPRTNKFNNPVKVVDPKKTAVVPSAHRAVHFVLRVAVVGANRLLWSTTHFFSLAIDEFATWLLSPRVRPFYFSLLVTVRTGLWCTNPSFPLVFRAI